jgi:XTP/dITP diphosphohydrolase
MASPQGIMGVAEGVCEGRIADAPRGAHGFGYDPIFEVPSLGRTLAEVEPEIKNRLSHRAQAMAKARQILQDLKFAI